MRDARITPQQYFMAALIAAACAVTIIYGYSCQLSELDGRIAKAEAYYPKLSIGKLFEGIENRREQLDPICGQIEKELRTNGMHESQLAAMHLTKKATDLIHDHPDFARALLERAVRFAPGYERAHLKRFTLNLWSARLTAAAADLWSVIYLRLLSPGRVLGTLGACLALFIAFIFTQAFFFGAMYAKYRRLLLHEAAELGIDPTGLSLAPYLEKKELAFMSMFGKNIVVALIFVVFFSYFSTGFGRVIRVTAEANTFLKNPGEFFAVNGIPDYTQKRLMEFSETLWSAFRNEKHSRDFYFYLAGLSRAVIDDRQGMSRNFTKITAYSFLNSKIADFIGGIRFLDDGDLYFALFSPVRSDPLFMVAVFLNVLLIIVFTIMINRARRDGERCEAQLCECGALACPECQVQVGLCNGCLAPMTGGRRGDAVMMHFYSIDRPKLMALSLLMPGITFFYMGNIFYGALFGFTIPLAAIAVAAGYALGAAPSYPFGTLFAVLYCLYFIENYILSRQKKLENKLDI